MLDQRIQRVNSVEEMQAMAAQVAGAVQGGMVLLLFGELGAGKTTFVQALAKVLGVGEVLGSPTFTIMSEYAIPAHPFLKTLVHADLYRLSPDTARQDPMVQEMLQQAQESGRLTVIEWADRLGEVQLRQAWKMVFAHGLTDHERVVDIFQG